MCGGADAVVDIRDEVFVLETVNPFMLMSACRHVTWQALSIRP
jgi:hypothetical protein